MNLFTSVKLWLSSDHRRPTQFNPFQHDWFIKLGIRLHRRYQTIPIWIADASHQLSPQPAMITLIPLNNTTNGTGLLPCHPQQSITEQQSDDCAPLIETVLEPFLAEV